MKKGFTLIELLAVIVILAIIALIAVPIILNIINDAKKEANERSIDLYASSVKNAVATYQLKESKLPTNFSDIESYIKYNGSEVICGIEELYNDGKIYLAYCTVDGILVDYIYGNEQEVEEDSSHLARKNVQAVTKPKVGITPTVDKNGKIKIGSTFKIKVNVSDTDGSIFYVLSNDGDYVNLIAGQNITIDGSFTSEVQANDEWYVSAKDNRYGPQTAYAYLDTATTNKWTNIPIIESFTYEDEGHKKNSNYGYQSIVTALDEATGNYMTTIIPYSSDYGTPATYENMRARLPYYSEITTNTSCTGSSGSCPLWMINYLKSSSYYSTSDGKVNSTGNNYGYWLISSYQGSNSNVYRMSYVGLVYYYRPNYAGIGIRPVITVLKSDLLRVMQ